MRRLKKNIFLGFCGSIVAVLGVVRLACPDVAKPRGAAQEADTMKLPIERPATVTETKPISPQGDPNASVEVPLHPHGDAKEGLGNMEQKSPSELEERMKWHPVRSVPSYAKCFPDVQDVQIEAARRWGVAPVRNREEAEANKDRLVYIAANPLYCIDSGLTHSIPYLVPRASELLSLIGRNYLDSLYVKGIPLHRIIVTSILRTEDDVARLQRRNSNATGQSCHLFGTTFDISYNRFSTVSPPGEERRAVWNDTLKWVLSEVLHDVREQGRCYVKYEVKQGCFHITVR